MDPNNNTCETFRGGRGHSHSHGGSRGRWVSGYSGPYYSYVPSYSPWDLYYNYTYPYSYPYSYAYTVPVIGQTNNSNNSNNSNISSMKCSEGKKVVCVQENDTQTCKCVNNDAYSQILSKLE